MKTGVEQVEEKLGWQHWDTSEKGWEIFLVPDTQVLRSDTVVIAVKLLGMRTWEVFSTPSGVRIQFRY